MAESISKSRVSIVSNTRFRVKVDQRTWHEVGDLIEHGTPQARILEMSLHRRR